MSSNGEEYYLHPIFNRDATFIINKFQAYNPLEYHRVQERINLRSTEQMNSPIWNALYVAYLLQRRGGIAAAFRKEVIVDKFPELDDWSGTGYVADVKDLEIAKYISPDAKKLILPVNTIIIEAPMKWTGRLEPAHNVYYFFKSESHLPKPPPHDYSISPHLHSSGRLFSRGWPVVLFHGIPVRNQFMNWTDENPLESHEK